MRGCNMNNLVVVLFLLQGIIFEGVSAVISESYIHYPYFPPAVTPRMRELRVLHSWKKAEFAFPSTKSRKEFLDKRIYIPDNVIILDADYWSKGKKSKLFVSMPRMKDGIPASLATVSTQRGPDRAPFLLPYPDWSWHGTNDCEGIISVFRTKLDECGRLWVVDAGVIDNLDTSERICPPKLLVFDAESDILLLKYVFPDEVLGVDSLLVTIAVDIRNGHCHDAFAYIADVTTYALIVFDAASHQSWKVTSNYFYPFPTHGSFSIDGENFDLMDGLLGLALSPMQLNGDRTLYFHSLASVREGKVSANLLRNSSNFETEHNLVSKKFYLSNEVRSSQSAAEDMSSQGILFYGVMNPPAIACWNSKLPFHSSNQVTVAQSNSTLQFASGMKVVWKDGKEELLVITSSFQKYILGSISSSRDNYHILTASIDDLTKDTLCDPALYHHKPRYVSYS